MRSIFQKAWPATVSEMLEDTETAHGMVFRSLMISGCLIMMQTDFSGLTPSFDDASSTTTTLIGIVHLLRKHVFALSVGFCFAPAKGLDHDVAKLRVQTTTAGGASGGKPLKTLKGIPWLRDTPMQELSSVQHGVMARTSIIGTVHVWLALGMLSFMPVLELIVVLYEGYYSIPSYHLVRIRNNMDPFSIAYCLLASIRLMHVVVMAISLGLFGYHFTAGFFHVDGGNHAYKGFWSEFAAAKLFAQLMVLAALQSPFSWPHQDTTTNSIPLFVIAALHAFWYASFCIRTFFLCMRNIEYTDAELCRFFDATRQKELIVQTFLDAQLAFIARVQQEFLNTTKNDDNSTKDEGNITAPAVVGRPLLRKQSSQIELLREQMLIIASFGSIRDIKKQEDSNDNDTSKPHDD